MLSLISSDAYQCLSMLSLIKAGRQGTYFVLFEGIACSPTGAVVHPCVGLGGRTQMARWREALEHFRRLLHRFEASSLRNANCCTLDAGRCVRALYSMRVGLW